LRSGLARIASEARLASPAAIESAVDRSLRGGERIVVTLVEVAHIGDEALADALARWLKLTPVPSLEPDSDAVRELTAETARRLHVLPIAVELPVDGPRLLRVAMADPTDEEAPDELESSTGCRVEPVLARLAVVDEAIVRAYRGVATAVMRRPGSVTGEHARAPFGGTLDVSTPHLPGGRLGTAPFRRMDEDAPLDVRLRALVLLLEQKGVVTAEEYLGMIRKLLGDRRVDDG
jgi:hypothetical protein